ncbi:LytTr DNA-binding domain protein [Vibrio aerogenes CECT 7868]|uniref:LytTr DNA-binding domain protein n=1 Tax=Vibrio aerogenes CECT 7868 TaxID=1216006 RepID=A0A1M6C5G5_9VIBR|nr:LytTR family DNA-binding domain-containing protein [Vibrio aerogenes]SHI56287.1 LytTr DNA-binding domain protein [Vibrio aerogenes CECT 7868]
MPVYKNHIWISVSVAVFVAIINIVIYSVSATHNEITVSKGVFTGIMRSMATSSTFMDDVYTFRVEHIGRNIQDLITMFEKNNSSLGICVTAEIRSFNSDDKVTNTYCSQNESMIALMSENRRNDLVSGEERIRIGQKELGHVSWFLAPSKVRPLFRKNSGDYSIPFIYACIEILFFLLLSRIIRTYIFKTSPDEDTHQNQTAMTQLHQEKEEIITENNLLAEHIAQLQLQLSNITKITEHNKRHFAINGDLLYAQYSHPYTNLYYASGKYLKVRCSLAILENSFPIRWIRINRSCVVNSQAIRERGIEYKSDKKSTLIIQIKNKPVELEVGKNYEEQLVQVFS